jgi:hypothetical protein
MKIEFDEASQVVSIDGVRFGGRIWEGTSCDRCGGPIVYFEDHDADFCPTCNEWKSTGLTGRPAKPMPLKRYTFP